MKCYVFSIACCFQLGAVKKEMEIQVGGGNPVRGGQKFLPSVGGVFLSGITQCYSVKCSKPKLINCLSMWN